MSGLPPNYFGLASRTPHGVRGLKYGGHDAARIGASGRTPHGVRGLKCRMVVVGGSLSHVAPLTGCVD